MITPGFLACATKRTELPSMERGQAGVEVRRDQQVHFGYTGDFYKHPDGGIK